MNKKTCPILTTDLDTFKKIIANSTSRIEVLRKFGLRPHGTNYTRLDKRVRENNISTSHFIWQFANLVKVNRNRRQPIKDVLVSNSSYNKTRLKERLLSEKILDNKCNICSMEPVWNGKRIVLILDHINGVHNDDRIENLQLVCPNCNSQLPTHCGKNRKALSNSYRCKDCGKVITRNKYRCRDCENTSRRKVKNRPSKEELLKDVSETNYQVVARKYGVCNATIRKWMR